MTVKKLRSLLAAMVLASSLSGCGLLEKLGLVAEAKVVCDQDGCRVEGHVHAK
jgi:predicted small lipoprotein YifL